MMFKSLALALCAASAVAFTPLRSAKTHSALHAAIDSYVGKSEELGGKIWDPLGFASVSDQSPDLQTLPHVKWLRESELKHGRICMLAFVGVIATQSGLHLPTYPAGVSWTEALGAACKNNPGGMAQIFAAVTVLEGYFYPGDMWTGGGDRDAGDFSLTPFKGKKMNDADFDKLRLQELKNGRAAMIAMAAIASAHLIPGSVPPFGPLKF